MRRNILFIVLIWLFIGCSVPSKERNRCHEFTSVDDVNTCIIDTKYYIAKPLLTKEDDWKDMGRWRFNYDYTETTILSNSLTIPEKGIFSGIELYMGLRASRIDKYDTVYHNALKDGNEAYFKNRYPYFKNKRTGEERKINVHIEYHGKENYPCLVQEERRGRQLTQLYSCFKSNKDKTLEQSVIINLIYNSIRDMETKYPYYAKKYSYEDLKERAKTTLDSLYIKDF